MSWIKYQGFSKSQFDIQPWTWWLIAVYCITPLLCYVVLPKLARKSYKLPNKVTICVLGDLGHSPRMCYHARSFIEMEYQVDLCGYLESSPPEDLMDSDDVEIMPISVIRNNHNLPFLVFSLYKVAYQLLSLSRLLFRSMENSKYVVVQNPPSLPVLFIVVVIKTFFFTRCKIVIDWHNLNYTILNLRFQNTRHPMVRLLKQYERILARFADLNLTVTNAMKQYLVKEFSIEKRKVRTLYDRPGSQFEPVQKKQVLESFPEVFKKHSPDDKILVTSTSFTPDEDFTSLLKCLQIMDTTVSYNVLVLVTGKGPLKEEFIEAYRKMNLQRVTVECVWLSNSDYPKVIGAADVGVSLHTSSSGIDLPMKILDLFGCGVPVVSLRFQAIGELVKEGVNGFTAGDAQEMSDRILEIFTDGKVYDNVKTGALEESKRRWKQNWNSVMAEWVS